MTTMFLHHFFLLTHAIKPNEIVDIPCLGKKLVLLCPSWLKPAANNPYMCCTNNGTMLTSMEFSSFLCSLGDLTYLLASPQQANKNAHSLECFIFD